MHPTRRIQCCVLSNLRELSVTVFTLVTPFEFSMSIEVVNDGTTVKRQHTVPQAGSRKEEAARRNEQAPQARQWKYSRKLREATVPLLDVTCESWSCLSRRLGSPPSGQPRTRDPHACARGRGSEDRERRDMVDVPRVETPSLSDQTKFTETQNQSTTQLPHNMVAR